jgi:hypothetical protein
VATGTRTTDTYAEGLRKLLGSLTDLKTTEDPNMPFIINLETAILQQLKQGATNALNGPTPPQAAAPGMPGMPGPGATPMAPGMAPGGLAPAAVPGLMQGPNMPNADELRRVLAQ